jgi:PAS domain S-box-containing protein
MASPRPSPPASLALPAWGELLEAASDLLALTDADGNLLWANAAFRRACPADTPLGAALGLAAEALSRLRTALADVQPITGEALGWTDTAGRPRRGLLTLMPLLDTTGLPPGARWQAALRDTTEAEALAAESARLAEQLETAQDFGRLGFWERQLPLGAGTWDRHMFRFFGLDPAGGVPDFEAVAARIHPDDRPGQRYRASSREPGRYTSRYRIMLPGQPPRHVHAQWEVKAGPDGRPALISGVMVDDTEVYELAKSFHATSAQLQMAMDLGNIAVWRHDFRTNRIYSNNRAFEVVGIPHRLEGMSLDEVREMIHPDDLPHVEAAAEQAMRTDRPVDMEARYRRTDGTWRYVLTRRMLRRNEHGDPIEFVGVALDVSEQVEETRHASEIAKRLEIAATAAGMGIWSRNPGTGRPEWNSQMFEIVGRAPALGPPSRHEWVEQIIHPDDRARMRNAQAEMLASNGTTVEHQYRIVRPDGVVRWLVNRSRHEVRDGKSVLFGITMDITQRVETEAALRRANERIALATHGAGIGTWEHDLVTDTVQWDAQMFRLRGLDPDAGGDAKHLRVALAHPDDLPRIQAVNDDSVRDRRMCTYEFRVRLPDGSYRWLASRSVPQLDSRGEVVRQVGVNWDIHERMTAEAERQDRLVAQRESEAKSQFLARMSHELRTPLNAVLGFAQLLQLGGRLDAEQLEKLGHIHGAGEHLLALINDVLDLSSLDQGQMKIDLQAVPLADVARESLPIVQSLVRRHDVGIALGPLDGVARGDRTRIRQVLINLLTNAIKYNRPQGQVTVTSRVMDDAVELAVTDTGRGMTPQQLNQLFEPFNRLGVEREGIEGTGIGLAVVKGLVQRMAGSIAVESEPGAGSRFTVRLPRQPEPAAPGDTPESGALPSPPRPRTRAGQLLYIEDNPINQLLVEELVRGHTDLAIESCDTGLAGVERAARLRPDLVLIDIQLPDIDGFEVLRRLRAHPATAGVPCIALSANAMPEDIARALAAGFEDYWTKPIAFGSFLAALGARFPAPPAAIG